MNNENKVQDIIQDAIEKSRNSRADEISRIFDEAEIKCLKSVHKDKNHAEIKARFYEYKSIELTYREIARILDVATVAAFQAAPNERIGVFDKFEHDCILLCKNSDMEIEVKRRFAETKMVQISARRESTFEEVRKLFDALDMLGYSDIWKESVMKIIFSQFCDRHGRTDVLLPIVTHLHAKLSQEALSCAAIAKSFYEEKIAHCERILQGL